MEERYSLSGLRMGERARVAGVEADPAMRRRLLDMGLIPGTQVVCVAVSPAGDPRAYLIRGAVIALRGRDARGVTLETEPLPRRAEVPETGEVALWA